MPPFLIRTKTPVLLTGELVDIDPLEQFDALPHAGGSQAEQGAHWAFTRRVRVTWRNHVASQQVGKSFVINSVVLVLAAVNRPEIERVGQDELDACLVAGIGQPLSTKEALTAHGHIVSPGSNLPQEEGKVVVADVHVEQLVALAVHHTDVHLPGVKIDSAVVLGCRGIVSHLF